MNELLVEAAFQTILCVPSAVRQSFARSHTDIRNNGALRLRPCGLYPADRVRDMALMDNTLAVIDAIMQRDRDLSSAFHDPQQFF